MVQLFHYLGGRMKDCSDQCCDRMCCKEMRLGNEC